MIVFFRYFKDKAQQENIDEDAFNSLFNGLKGIAFLDNLEEAEKNKEEIEKLNMERTIPETTKVGLDNLKRLIQETMEGNKRKTKNARATKS